MEPLATEVTASDLCNPDRFTLPQAVQLALKSTHPNLALELLRTLVPGADGLFLADRPTMRALEILSGLPPSEASLPPLLGMVRRSDARVLSKVVLLAGRIRPAASWFGDFCRKADPRMRANAVESLWGSRDSASVALFAAAAGDPHHRVAANAYVGLHLAGDPAGRSGIERMAASADPLWRAAGAWALGVTGSDPDSPPIQALLSDAEFPVRGAALRAVVRLRKRSNDPPATAA